MDLKEIKAFLGSDWTSVGEVMKKALASDIQLLNATNEGLLANAGKQLRPLLVLLAARACSGGKATVTTYHYAAATELLHNATLLHDDVADDSDERRGRPTIKAMMGPSVSVLLGDYWLVKAMNLIMCAPDYDLQVVSFYSSTLASLAEGEILQIQKAGLGDTDENDYLKIIYGKTASLFEAAVKSGACSVKAPEAYAAAVAEYATSLGLAFQIQDDILDYDGNEHVGKPLGVDIVEQKITMPLLGALGQVSPEEQQAVRKMVTDIHNHPEYREVILDFVRNHGGVAAAQEKLAFYVRKAVAALAVLPDSVEKEALANLARFTATRDF